MIFSSFIFARRNSERNKNKTKLVLSRQKSFFFLFAFNYRRYLNSVVTGPAARVMREINK